MSKSVNILLIEDDPNLSACVADALKLRGFTVQTISDGYVAKSVVTKDVVDLIILDLGLPGYDGRDVLDCIRANNPFVPVLLMSGRAAVDERVGCFEQGADDFLPKPFSLAELAARTDALLRRCSRAQILRFEDLSVDMATRRLTMGARSEELTQKEFLLLQHLSENAGRIVSRSDLLRRVWGMNFDPSTNVVDVYVTYLRKKLDPCNPMRFIKTHRGKGYEWTVKPQLASTTSASLN